MKTVFALDYFLIKILIQNLLKSNLKVYRIIHGVKKSNEIFYYSVQNHENYPTMISDLTKIEAETYGS